MKFEQFLNREAVPEWRPKYLNYHLLKDHLRNIPFAQSDKRREEEFFRDARKELKKIDQFYTCKQQELLAKYSSSSLSKKDLIILYTETDFLKSFKSLNVTAVRKILKKFVKVTGGEVAARAFQGEVETFQFWANETVLDALSTRIEELFTLKYSSGDRHRAMRRLRLRNFKNESFHSAAMFAGIFWSLTVAFSVYIATVFHARNSQLIHIYASHFLPLLAFGLFSINSFAFKRSFVNYRFIFQFDKRSALHECQYAALTGLFAFTFVASSLIVLIIRNGDDSFNGPSINFIPLLSVLLVLLNPSPWPWYSARLWIIKAALRIPSSPFFPVTFKDFFINDHLISQAYFFQGILLAFNVESVHWAIKLVPIIPNLTRTLQCLRRYKDTKIMLNLLNTSKYSLAIFIIILRAIFSSKKTSIDILQAASSLFSLYWDIVMDFGLLQVTRDYKSFLLRDQLVVFPYKIVYYYMLLFNCVGRFMWVFSSNTLLSQNDTSLLLAIIEILRRFHWSFLRIEYEHLNNCNSFRAVDDTKRIPEEEEGRTADLFYKDMVSESKPLDDKEGNDEIVDEYDYEMTENSV